MRLKLTSALLAVATAATLAVVGSAEPEAPSVYADLGGGIASGKILVNYQSWLAFNGVGVFAGGEWLSTAAGSLKMSGQPMYTQGQNAIGLYNSTRWNLMGSASGNVSVHVVAEIRDYIRMWDGRTGVSFDLWFPQGLDATGGQGEGGVNTRFPAFDASAQGATQSADLGLLTWHGNQACASAELECTYTARANDTGFSQYPGGLEGGQPTVLFDRHSTRSGRDGQAAAVIIPASSFMVSNHVYEAEPKLFSCGIMGTVTSLPANFRYSTLIVAGSGVNDAMAAAGMALRRLYNKVDVRYDKAVADLRYETANGAFEYYNPQNAKGEVVTYDKALESVLDFLEGEQLPIQMLQIDSWWYPKDPTDLGVLTWTALPEVFPNGLQAFHEAIEMGLVAHNRYWSPRTPYAKQNGGDYDFVIDEYAMPTEKRFWTDLFRNSTVWGLRVYEQDWLDREIQHVRQARESATLARDWLVQMGEAASDNGITVMYCMPNPRHLLQSVEVPAVTHTRVSDDLHPGNTQWSIGVSTILSHSLGLGCFKDSFWSGTEIESLNPQYGPLAREGAAPLQSAVALFSMGPVSPSDKAGKQNNTNIMRTCDGRGHLLKPSVPMTALDTTFAMRAWGDDAAGPDGELWSSYSEHPGLPGLRWGHLLAPNLAAPYSPHLSELKGDLASMGVSASSLVAWRGDVAYNSSTALLELVDLALNGSTVVADLPALDKHAFQLWHLAPVVRVAGGEFAALGEVADKWVPFSPERVSQTAMSQVDGLLMRLTGAPGEVVSFWVARRQTPADVWTVEEAVRCKLGPGSAADVRIPTTAGASTCQPI